MYAPGSYRAVRVFRFLGAGIATMLPADDLRLLLALRVAPVGQGRVRRFPRESDYVRFNWRGKPLILTRGIGRANRKFNTHPQGESRGSSTRFFQTK